MGILKYLTLIFSGNYLQCLSILRVLSQLSIEANYWGSICVLPTDTCSSDVPYLQNASKWDIYQALYCLYIYIKHVPISADQRSHVSQDMASLLRRQLQGAVLHAPGADLPRQLQEIPAESDGLLRQQDFGKKSQI